MKIDIRCLQCNIEQMIKISEFVDVTESKKEQVAREVFGYLKDVSFDKTNPEIMKGTWSIITEGFGVPDPYKEIKEYYNGALMDIYDDMKDILNKSSNSFESALKMAATGNIIDFGPNHQFSKESLVQELSNLNAKKIFEIDYSEQLYNQLRSAKKLLYIGDNCGEIVLDKLFIEEIHKTFPKIDIDFSVRGKPILNDVTIEDAQMINMDEVANVIENGDGSPGTILHQTSLEFKESFKNADVIIAKGQGNYESLSEVKRAGLFLVLMAKCPIVSEYIGVENMKCVCVENS